MQRRGVVVTDTMIAGALQRIAGRLPGGAPALAAHLRASGVGMRTLYDQLRVQIGWGEVLRQTLAREAPIGKAEIAHQAAVLKAETGRPEYNIGEIFIPGTTPAQARAASSFADTVIQQLRAGAPFPLVAAQFSQADTALGGGVRGWVRADEVDPAVARVLAEMPPGAISNPIRVPGGIDIVMLRAKRVIGEDMATVVQVRQIFLRFATPLNPQAPTAAQRAAIEHARQIATTARSCPAMEAAAKAAGDARGGNPGPIRLDAVPVPALRQVLATQPVGVPTQPLIANDGVAVMVVCSRQTKNLGIPDARALRQRIMRDRVDLASRQMLRDLERRALIQHPS